jgi:ERCC4-type nuclease
MTDIGRHLVIVSPSEPEEMIARLNTYGLNAVSGEAGTDYVWFVHTLRFGIERKTITNLLQSLRDRQLVEQAHRGVSMFDHYILLIEGEYRQATTGRLEYHYPNHPEADASGWVQSGWQYEAVDGMLFELGLLGVHIVRCKLYDAARKIASIVGNTADTHRRFIRERQRPELPVSTVLGGELYSDVLWSLCALPGIGPETASALLDTYGTLIATIEAIADGSAESVSVNGRKLGSRLRKARAAVTSDWKGS